MKKNSLTPFQLPVQANRILDVAADLLMKWGYKRVTVGDIASQAGLSAGTLYEYWKSKKAIFEAVLLRELLSIWNELLEVIEADPNEVLLHRQHYTLQILLGRRPLARAFFSGDSTLLEELALKPDVSSQQLVSPKELLLWLRGHGLVRTDRDLSLQAYTYGMIMTGSTLADPFLAGEEQLSVEEKAEALAQLIRDVFEPSILPSPGELRERIVPEVKQFFMRLRDLCQERIEERLVMSQKSSEQKG
ncbi:TetR/AcrR family transcriptional regulator [Ktedonosporobacter rubrisoli]|uniref:TetR/AcrR family transcriptional regulator n=1 Tax=Ktedonosporobacter rubrisoli TaxID=2509675 RepID=A0A4P6JM94_KTERU|nr:TetR/AcrR family transcriptional regulator [Ktedonosporobacter rubrisoli]QBD76132.1 TetR/AcrR family transcriptional regulator [Ktedonosporobacter rubrisoli]